MANSQLSSLNKNMSGHLVPLYVESAFANTSGKKNFVSVKVRKRADVDPKAKFAGAYVSNYVTNDGKKDKNNQPYHTQPITLENFNKILKVNNRQPITETVLQNASKNKVPLIVSSDNIAFNSNIAIDASRLPAAGSAGTYFFNQSDIHKGVEFDITQEKNAQKAAKSYKKQQSENKNKQQDNSKGYLYIQSAYVSRRKGVNKENKPYPAFVSVTFRNRRDYNPNKKFGGSYVTTKIVDGHKRHSQIMTQKYFNKILSLNNKKELTPVEYDKLANAHLDKFNMNAKKADFSMADGLSIDASIMPAKGQADYGSNGVNIVNPKKMAKSEVPFDPVTEDILDKQSHKQRSYEKDQNTPVAASTSVGNSKSIIGQQNVDFSPNNSGSGSIIGQQNQQNVRYNAINGGIVIPGGLDDELGGTDYGEPDL